MVILNDAATTEIYTLSLHDALPILAISRSRFGVLTCGRPSVRNVSPRHWSTTNRRTRFGVTAFRGDIRKDRKSTRLNSSHANIPYAVSCLNNNTQPIVSQTTLHHAL